MIGITPINIFPTQLQKRSCGECNVCCHGWLDADVPIGDTVHKLRKGTACPYVCAEGCSIYRSDLRPKHPCDTYECMWKDHEEIPDWMRPDKSGVILTEKYHKNIPYVQMVETGKKVDSTILAELIQFTFMTNRNLEYVVDGRTYHLGSQEFMQMVIEDLDEKRQKSQKQL